MDELDDLRLSLAKNIFASLDRTSSEDYDLQDVKTVVTDGINRWLKAHPGLEDHTVECVACHKPTTMANRIESDHWGEPKYLCGRCCDGITTASGNLTDVERQKNWASILWSGFRDYFNV